MVMVGVGGVVDGVPQVVVSAVVAAVEVDSVNNRGERENGIIGVDASISFRRQESEQYSPP